MPYISALLPVETECVREQDSALPVLDNTFLLTRFKLGGNTPQSWAHCQHEHLSTLDTCYVLALSPPVLSWCY